MGDNRETVAQAMYGKSEEDLEIEEQRELKRLMKEAPNEAEAAREHDEAVRSDNVAIQDAATHQQDNFDPMHEASKGQQLSAAGAPEIDATRAAYPSQSAQQVTARAVSDKKP